MRFWASAPSGATRRPTLFRSITAYLRIVRSYRTEHCNDMLHTGCVHWLCLRQTPRSWYSCFVN